MVLAGLLAASGVALAGCSTNPGEPQVTVYAHGTSRQVSPVQYCEVTEQRCAPPNVRAVTELRVPPNDPLQISVPGDVASTPWQVSFLYRGANGQQLDGRSPVLLPDKDHAYTLRLPADGAQLEHVEIQQYGAALIPDVNGGFGFGIRGSWVINVNPNAPADS